MSRYLVAPEEVRDALYVSANALLSGRGDSRTVAWLADDLICSESTVRRHLRVLIDRGWVAKRTGTRPAVFTLTTAGRRAAVENESL